MSDAAQTLVLDDATVRAIAAEVARLLRAPAAQEPPPEMVDAHEIGRMYGRTAAWVRAHAEELGGIQLGTGPRPRWGFDPQRVAELVERGGLSGGSSLKTRRQRTPSAPQHAVPLLPIRGVPA